MVLNATATERERPRKLFGLILTWICLLGIPVAGETSVQWLGQHFAWSDGTRFASRACFWGFWCIALATWLIVAFRRELAVRLRMEEGAEKSPQAVTPRLTPAQSAMVVAGCYLTIFAWLISLTWRQHDRMTALGITGAMLVLGVWNYFQSLGKTGVAATRSAYGHLTLCCAVVLAVINLRPGRVGGVGVWDQRGRSPHPAALSGLFPR